MSNLYIKLSVAVAFTAILPSSGSGDDSPTPPVFEWKNQWSSNYSRALGGSQTAHAITEDALFANPAGLNKTRHPRSRLLIDVIEFPGLTVGGNKTALGLIKRKTLQPSLWLKSLASDAKSERGYLEMQMFPWAVLGERGGPTFFLGLPVRSTLTANPSTDAGLTRTILTETTATVALSSSISSASGAAIAGISLRPNIRWNSAAEYKIEDITSSKALLGDLKSDTKKTTSTAVDVGIIITSRDYWLPSFGLSVLNLPTGCIEEYVNPGTGKTQSICGAKRTGGVQRDQQNTQIDPTEVRAGVSVVPRFRIGSAKVNLKISGDIYPLPISFGGKNYGLNDVNINQLTHAGVELFLGSSLNARSLSLRGGINETRLSWGFALPLPHFNLELTSYEAALITNGDRSKERRYLLGLSSDW